MNCEILETLYIKSNGDIPCHCDVGEQVLLGKVVSSDPLWSILNVLTNKKYEHIKTALTYNNVPWDGICNDCALLREDEPFSDMLVQKHIKKIQIEPSLACTLECPGCSNKIQKMERAKPHLMKLEVLETLFSNLSQSLYEVEHIVYCGQGEPLMHPQFPEFIMTVRKHYPNAQQSVITNGNFDYWKVMQGAYIDKIIVSCDGIFQANYEKYRIGGNVERVIKFMKDIPKTIDGKNTKIIWKYILFDFNDSDEELLAAQRLANAIGVDTLMFVVTHSKYKSVRYNQETVANLPVIYPNVITNLTPQHFSPKYAASEPDFVYTSSKVSMLFRTFIR